MSKYVVNPVLVRMKESSKGSIYQSIVAMGFRARQINDFIKLEMNDRMADIVPTPDDSDTVNFDQLSISKEFDKLPKPTFMAMREIYDEKLHFKLED
ncbi:MAG TPA: DNA-directed RNA polymerase subunit omega [Candidatus Kapabacteria bacterium]|nr:DNA-directed RNA polymerase subunit omega [Candidatus Kapabacteria bacterium]